VTVVTLIIRSVLTSNGGCYDQSGPNLYKF